MKGRLTCSLLCLRGKKGEIVFSFEIWTNAYVTFPFSNVDVIIKEKPCFASSRDKK